MKVPSTLHREPSEARCWLCDRPLGHAVQWHHPVPKARKGRDVVAVHPICHKTIHACFTNAELVRIGADRARLLAREDMARFVAWVAGKPPDFNAPVRQKR